MKDDRNGKGTTDGKGRRREGKGTYLREETGRYVLCESVPQTGNTSPPGHTHHHHHHLLPQHLKIKMEGTDTEYSAMPGFGCTFQSLGSGISHSRDRFERTQSPTLSTHARENRKSPFSRIILDDDLTRGNGGSSSFEARLVSIVHGTMNTSDSIHLQAARRTPREDLELYFSDGACRYSLALTQYATVLCTTLAFNPPSQIFRSREYRFKATSTSLSPTTSCTLTAKTSRHHWGRIELSFNDWPPLLQEQNVVPREYHFGVVFCITCSIRPTWLQRGRSDGHAGTSHGTYSRTQ
ncbi:hypothetical protein CTAM01_09091 [Colletotrichum tamarilloi]|uniref:Uncharacterized protein n=1 Tax=Colletotrichum tamarilloi TaxID=1209934 RepID=A0ABQ9R4H7_9PEZI|nr:uncharacterized protein CTAM01_09091 [Colletotrichum tamarilloi]KAK1494210.1 hypothetical protein CTAM01_09091 [Colletotrichum tamarilloi]